jgi:predicted  nucleic acid-binding Zn-ribbon protein
MDEGRIDHAIKRIETAMERIDAARAAVAASSAKAAGGSARVIELVNTHEKLREHVAETLRELDDVGQLEE